MERKQVWIYGAKSLALGICEAVRALYPEAVIQGFIVSSLRDNPSALAGMPVYEIAKVRDVLRKNQNQIQVLIAAPEDMHKEMIQTLKELGDLEYVCIDSHGEGRLMEKYYAKKNLFLSLHALSMGREKAEIQVYQVKSHRDKPVGKIQVLPEWIKPLQAGGALTEVRCASVCDCQGENISEKNGNYCELTALYWLWKNKLAAVERAEGCALEYYGLFHYRRILEVTEEDLYRLKENEVDVILPFPTLHEPDLREHHGRYVEESDWDAMLRALEELHPESVYECMELMRLPYFYNYNLLIARKKVLADYCAWLFPILEYTERLSNPGGRERADRYIGYLGESLMTLYFLYHRKDLKIYHTGRIMLT